MQTIRKINDDSCSGIHPIEIQIFPLFRTNFGDENAKAIDTTWYKRAVDQDQIDPESFVFSVPFDSGYVLAELQEILFEIP